jgi:hypothetical protein
MVPNINKRVFWDVDPLKLDFVKKSRFVIERVFERGDVGDIRALRSYYGDEQIKRTLQNAVWLEEGAVYLAASLFDCSLNSFKCYKPSALNQEHWTY